MALRRLRQLKLAFGDALPEDIILSVFQQCGENVKKAEAQLLELTGQTPAAAPAPLVEVSNVSGSCCVFALVVLWQLIAVAGPLVLL